MKKLAVIVSKLLDNNVEIASQVGVDLPGITLTTQEVSGAGYMGKSDLPITGQVEGMELKISTQGLSADQMVLARSGRHQITLRFAQDSMSVQKGIIPEGCKIYATTVFKSMDGGSIKNANPYESAVTHEVLRYQMIVNGVEVLLINREAYKYIVNGADLTANVWSLVN